MRNKGITLIALVVTVIVLIILSGVVITMLTGESGILTQAQNAKIVTEISQMKEEWNIKKASTYSTQEKTIYSEFTYRFSSRVLINSVIPHRKHDTWFITEKYKKELFFRNMEPVDA